MKLYPFLSIVFLFMFNQASANDVLIIEKVKTHTKNIESKAIEWRRHFHAHPELSNREKKTALKVKDVLKSFGVDSVTTGVAHHGIVAVIEGDNPGDTFALRADMDALPISENSGVPFASKNEGIMHACGHDAHTAILLAVAHNLCKMRSELHGRVKLIFQPAEEGPPVNELGGARMMISEGVLEHPHVDVIAALHVDPTLEVGKIGVGLKGVFASIDRVKLVIKGKQTHAAMPWKGIDPVLTSAHVIVSLQSGLSREIDSKQPLVVSFGKLNGGNRWNIIPKEVSMEGTIRTLDPDVRNQVRKYVNRSVKDISKAFRANAEVEIEDLTPVLWNDEQFGKVCIDILQNTIGKSNVKEVEPTLAGEDFAFFAHERPGFYFRLGIRNEEVGSIHPVHNELFTIDEAAISEGVNLMTCLPILYLKHHSVNGNISK